MNASGRIRHGTLLSAVIGALTIASAGPPPSALVAEAAGAGPNIYTYAGDGSQSYTSGAVATATGLNTPAGIAVDAAGDIFIAGYGDDVVSEIPASSGQSFGRYLTAGDVYTIAGTKGVAGHAGDGGPGTAATLNQPQGVAADAGGNLYIADTANDCVRRVAAASGDIATVAGQCGVAPGSLGDAGPATAATLGLPSGVALDGAGNLFITGNGSDRVREVAAAAGHLLGQPSASMTPGDIYTIAGGGTSTADGVAATTAALYDPSGLALDPAGNLFIADEDNKVVREVAAAGGDVFGQTSPMSAGDIYTVAGTIGTPGYTGDGGPASRATLENPLAIAFDAGGNLLVSDSGNNLVREVSKASGTISLVAGQVICPPGPAPAACTGNNAYSGDGGPAAQAALNQPYGIVFDARTGDVFISDSYNNRIREVLLNPPAAVSPTSGTPQSAAVGTQYAAPLVVSVTDGGGHPLAGIGVRFAAPVSGASGSFAGGQPTYVTRTDSYGLASATLTANRTAGSFAVTATVDGTSLTTAFSLTNTLDATSVSLTSTADPMAKGKPVAFTATVTPAGPGAGSPSGSVTFEDGGSVIGSAHLNGAGQASITTSALQVGTHSITAVYGGDAGFGGAASPPLTETITATAGASLSPGGLSFPGRRPGTTSPSQAVVLTNSGSAPLHISGVSTTGDFAETSSCPATLAPTVTCSISVTFAPMSLGSLAGTLTVTDDDVNGASQSIGLAGLATRPVCPKAGSAGAAGPPDPGRPWTGGSDAVGVASGWFDAYFAEGYTGAGFQEYLTVQNPGAAQPLCVDYLLDTGTVITRVYALDAQSRTTINVNQEVGAGQNVSAHLYAAAPFVAERPMYFNYEPNVKGWTGGDDVMGARSLGSDFYFAEGYTGSGFDEYLTLMNPDPSRAAQVDITYFFGDGAAPKVVQRTIPAHSRATVYVNATDQAGPGRNVSIEVRSHPGSDVLFLAERPMYFDYQGQGNRHLDWTGGDVVVGATHLSSDLNLAEGYVTPDTFDEWLTVLNPNDQTAYLTVTYEVQGGAPIQMKMTVDPHSRGTHLVNGDFTQATSLGLHIHSAAVSFTGQPLPVLVERPMYFDYNSKWTGGHDAIAVDDSQLGTSFQFAEGYVTPTNFDEYLTILNDTGKDAKVTITYLLRGGGVKVIPNLTVPANSRFTEPVNADFPGQTVENSIQVTSTNGVHILVERPMYFAY
ncbi:MAG: Ig-like domain repeat protein [Candidatus Dormibacteraceae bacterium]